MAVDFQRFLVCQLSVLESAHGLEQRAQVEQDVLPQGGFGLFQPGLVGGKGVLLFAIALKTFHDCKQLWHCERKEVVSRRRSVWFSDKRGLRWLAACLNLQCVSHGMDWS